MAFLLPEHMRPAPLVPEELLLSLFCCVCCHSPILLLPPYRYFLCIFCCHLHDISTHLMLFSNRCHCQCLWYQFHLWLGALSVTAWFCRRIQIQMPSTKYNTNSKHHTSQIPLAGSSLKGHSPPCWSSHRVLELSSPAEKLITFVRSSWRYTLFTGFVKHCQDFEFECNFEPIWPESEARPHSEKVLSGIWTFHGSP